MNLSATHYVPVRLILEIDPRTPQQVQQLAYQLEAKIQQIVMHFSYYSLLLACLLGVVSVLFGSLMLILDYVSSKQDAPSNRPSPCQASHNQLTSIPDTRIAKANRAELQLGSARIRSGQLSN